MQAVAANAVMLGLVALGGWEIVLILGFVLILFGARRLPGLGRGLRLGIREFRRATREVTDEIDEAASEAGRSVGGIYGKPAAEALTPDNRVAELYDPAELRDRAKLPTLWKVTWLLKSCAWIRRFLQALCRVSDRM
jgi:sec-independent protein translocase protein TatA